MSVQYSLVPTERNKTYAFLGWTSVHANTSLARLM